MDISNQILSDVTIFMKYARFNKDKQRRETWKEIAERNMNMHLKRYEGNTEELKKLQKEIKQVYTNFVIPKKVLPSMRSIQFAGKPIEISPHRLYNCAYLPIDHPDAFHEVMFLLLGGTGVGFSVQKHHVEKLPPIIPPKRSRRYLIGDSIEGWSDAIKVLLKAYLRGKTKPRFDFSDIRPKGAELITSGGKAPGPEPLKDCLHNLKKILDRKNYGEYLTPLEVHDMICYIADAVLAGGIRRAALISLFSFDDNEMRTCKFGNWFELNPQRGRANNSAITLRHRIKSDEFFNLWNVIKESGSGEPGVYFSNDQEWGTNPCVEIGLRAFQFCNLTTINASTIINQEDLNERAKTAAFLGTLQAGYTDFHYLRDIWQKTTEKDALLGVSMTGVASGGVLKLNLTEAANVVLTENERVAKIIGINKAARATAIKPEGTSSLVLGSASGIHAWHGEYYLRRIRVGKNESIYNYLIKRHPELMEDDIFNPDKIAIISVPQKAPNNAILRTEPVLDLLGRVKKFNEEWVNSGHREGANHHNVSATISIKEDEWKVVGEWIWKYKDLFNGLSVLPYDGGNYKQAPFEEISKYKFYELHKHLTSINLTKVIENEDNTNLKSELACAGNSCEIT